MTILNNQPIQIFNNSKNYIIAIAKTIFDIYSVKRGDKPEEILPVDVHFIAQTYGILIFETEGNIGDGFSLICRNRINKEDPEYIIAVNKNKHLHRNRFTIAHELGHILLNHFNFLQQINLNLVHYVSEEKDPCYEILKETTYPIQPNEIKNILYKMEKEANLFASELLVPTFYLKKYNNLSVEELSRIFCVSKNVIQIKMNYSSLTERIFQTKRDKSISFQL